MDGPVPVAPMRARPPGRGGGISADRSGRAAARLAATGAPFVGLPVGGRFCTVDVLPDVDIPPCVDVGPLLFVCAVGLGHAVGLGRLRADAGEGGDRRRLVG
ncbi:MAG: hypothetical protein QOE61_5877 [Micromonosporaceae bacterium]|nr:hypothetical protein [Micromonosporaceae bacterium]